MADQQNLALFGVLFIVLALALGFFLAVLIDQRIRAEDLLRSVFLYPFSMSFIVTGLAGAGCSIRRWVSLRLPTTSASRACGSIGSFARTG